MPSVSPALLWFRLDLRLADNPALAAAAGSGRPVIPVFVLDDADAGDRAPGGASRWWLHGSLAALDRALRDRGSRLTLRRGPAERVLADLVAETGAGAVFWNRRYEPWATARDARIKQRLKDAGVEARSFNAGLLREPWEVTSKQGTPFKVFTPFWKALQAAGEPSEPRPAPGGWSHPDRWPGSEALDAWALRPSRPDWAGGLRATWVPGEAAANDRLDRFLDEAAFAYKSRRNRPDGDHTSGLSPHLHYGEIGPRQVWHAARVRSHVETGSPMAAGVAKFLSEIGWREFSYHLLHQFPDLPDRPLRDQFAGFPWIDDPDGLAAWQRGRTGYPIVDAGMRQLWETGWMHNRVRMITASFLIKDLLIDWRAGERWFWDTLVDADLASNAASWQWVAGCGADAAPYFRIFNPVLQGDKFDPQGRYVRRWLPELAGLPDRLIHQPWEARPLDLADAGVRLGRDYPEPIVRHREARDRALAALQSIKSG